MGSISGIEAVGLVSELLAAMHEKLVEDKNINLADWLAIATEIGKRVFDEYSDEDDV